MLETCFWLLTCEESKLKSKQPPRPQAREFGFAEWVSVAGGFGLAPFAPGTWGSIPGVALGALASLYLESTTKIILMVTLTLFSAWAIAKTEKKWQRHDDKAIVIDEVVGQVLCLAWIPVSLANLLLGFLLFRAYDIFKPEPAGFFDRWNHSLGTLLDDVVAGIMAGVCLYALQPILYP